MGLHGSGKPLSCAKLKTQKEDELSISSSFFDLKCSALSSYLFISFSFPSLCLKAEDTKIRKFLYRVVIAILKGDEKMDWNDKRVLVTSGVGFIGAHLVKRLLDLECYVGKYGINKRGEKEVRNNEESSQK